ncbi:hypothetical protein [Phenylobacterium sp. J367]|uniref:hypothetical protein n=1 Tax=Phenylobacterium sp. J367 TaxID=2898435 RepID=UPI002150BD06|nr:hypothetical protein [Phenylobacterium sp. J367]MCR5879947.1 hypothetical protein [Phenylobacterium sp. J367]
MAEPIRILLQTTIPPVEDDWHIGRFSRLTEFLRGLDGVSVTARDREAPGGETDPVLGSIDTSDFDQVWLFAVDIGDGLNSEECAAFGRFHRRGGGLMVTRDHMDLGSSVCTLGGVGDAHFFHSRNLDPDASRHTRDDPFTTYIDWPNYHSGANGDFQEIALDDEPHPLFRRPDGGPIRRLPAHPHEGAVGVPNGRPARVIARGRSKVSGRDFNIAVAFEGGPDGGPAVAQSTFHHFADYNLDPRLGCPSFVDEPPGDGILRDPEALADTLAYYRNLAHWLAGRPL